MKRLLLSIIFVLFLGFPGAAYSNFEVRVGYFENDPLSFTDKDGLARGFAIDVIEALGRENGWTLIMVPGSLDECLARLSRGQIDVVAALPFSYEYGDNVQFSTNSLVADWAAVYVDTLPVTNIQELAGRYIGFASGDPHADVFNNLVGNIDIGFTLIQFENYEQVLRAVANGTVEAGIVSRLFGLRYSESADVTRTSVLFDPVTIRIAVSQQAADRLLPVLDMGLEHLKTDEKSVYHSSLRKWLSPAESSGGIWNSPYLWGGVSIFVVLQIIASFWIMRRLSASSSEVSRHEEALKEETEVRKRAQIALWESVERHRAMFTDNMLPQLLVDAETFMIMEVNPAAEAFYGYEPGKLLKMDLHDLNGDSQGRLNSLLQEVSMGRNRIETRHRLSGGRLCDVELFISTLYIHDQMQNLITVLDISERMAAERALSASEERLGLAVKGGQLAFWDLDVDTKALVVNDRFAEILGYRKKELGETFDDMIGRVHPDDYTRVNDDFKRCFESEDGTHFMQYRVRTKSGEWRWLASRGRVSQRTATGKPKRMTGIAYDITQRKQTEDRLSNINACMLGFGPDPDGNIRSLTRLAGTMLNGCAAFYSRARQMNLTMLASWNVPADQRYYEVGAGHLSHDLMGRGVEGLSLVHNLRTSKFAKSDPDVRRLDAQTYLGQIIKVEGNAAGVLCILFRENYTPTESDEKLFGIVAAAIKVEEERKLSGEQLVQAKEAAETASRAKSEFLANMSHEIRTPLNGIFGMLQLIGATDLTVEQTEFVGTALTSGRSLLRVINDVLDFSKMEAGMLALESTPLDFRQVAKSVLDNFTVQAAEKGLAMSVDIDMSLPPILLGDEARIRQILFNLVGNGVKFTPSGCVSVEAWAKRIGDASADMRLYITVSDTGIGIPDDMIDSVFSAFSQVDGSYTRRYGGTGLGLGIVKRLVNLMGGEIAVESDEHGTRIHLFVNVKEELGLPMVADATVPASIHIKPLSVLLVEDERVNRLSVKKHLEKLGHRVAEAEDGQKALDLLQWNEFDVVLMDIQMPNMDGLTATRAIRGSKSLGGKAQVPVVALTAHAMKGDRERFLDAGMDDYLAKPVEFVDLISVLSKVSPSLRGAESRP